MQRAGIRSRLGDVAKRYESDIANLQSLRQFAGSLEDCEDQEVFHGLIRAFEECGYLGKGFWRQEVAGRMLVSRRPKPDMPIDELLVRTAPNYNLSVEQLPWYLALAYGRDVFRAAVKERLQAADLPEREQKSLDCYL